MPWDLLGHLGLLSLWAACGLVPWSVMLIAGRGRGTFAVLPVAIVAGIVGGLLVATVMKDWTGVVVSLFTATAASAIAIAAFRRMTQEMKANG